MSISSAREDIVGRANVEDTPELEAYYQELAQRDAGALWTIANNMEPWQPKPESVPYCWHYNDLYNYVLRSLELVTPEQAGRRVVYLANPGCSDKGSVVGKLYTGLQAMQPGESATAHRHAAAALRFIIEGEGAYTIVDGHKVSLEPNDFVITPNGTWHEHGVAENGTTCVWQDGLDMPLVNALDANYYEVHPSLYQKQDYPLDDSTHTYGQAGLLPANVGWQNPYSPLFRYAWSPAYEALRQRAEVTEGSPYNGIMMDFVNPVTGGPVMQTIGAQMQLLLASQHTKAHRHVGSVVYHVAKGQGYSVINGQHFDWREHDVFVVPSWAWHEHANLSQDDQACLFAFHDLPAICSLGLYREEALQANGGYQKVTQSPTVSN